MHDSIEVVDLDQLRPRRARLLLAQPFFESADWARRNGLYFLRDPTKHRESLRQVLAGAREHTVDIVVLPELSVPVESLELLRAWSQSTGGIIVAGTHYHESSKGYTARSPVLVGNDVFITEKLHPSPYEISPVEGRGLSPGTRVLVFLNSRVGNFAVAICSDYLEPSFRAALHSFNLDILCVPAFQRDSTIYHERMHIGCQESPLGTYILYANNLCPPAGDGHSSLFAVMDNLFHQELIEAGMTDGRPPTKVCQLTNDQQFVVADCDLVQKRPTRPRGVATRPNVFIVSHGATHESQESAFGRAIGHDDQRYRDIASLFVAPVEYPTILGKLEDHKLLFLVGDPGIGKTYTAVRLLRDYFGRGYRPTWFTGLEKEERALQRRVLEDFQPRDREIIYFEDPFGRTTFERRDVLLRIFGPLRDHLANVDARVVITSRREVFEKFSHETPSTSQLRDLAEFLSVVKPSYPTEALTTILARNATGRCKWYSRPRLRRLVERAINDGILSTPLAIRDLVFSAERVETETELLARIMRRRDESIAIVGEEIAACEAHVLLVFIIVFLFGFKHQYALSQLYAATVRKREALSAELVTSSFSEVVRDALSYRLEQYGGTHAGLRFVHPIYEEALVDAIRCNRSAEALFDLVIRSALNEWGVRPCALTARRHMTKHRDLCLHILQMAVDQLLHAGNMQDAVWLGAQLIGAYDRTEDERFVGLMQRVAAIADPVAMINGSGRTDRIHDALRCAYNFAIRDCGRNLKELERAIDWNGILQTLRKSHVSLFSAVSVLEWAHLIRESLCAEFFAGAPPTALQRYVLGVPEKQRRELLSRLGRMLPDRELDRVRVVFSHKNVGRKWRQDWLAQEVPEGCAIACDSGAVTAMRRGYNLLPAGVTRVVGLFGEGMPIEIQDDSGGAIGIGVVEYSAEEVRAIAGHHSGRIAEIIGKYHGPAVIRRWALFLRTGQDSTTTGTF
jgi:predicted amidohydrolase